MQKSARLVLALIAGVALPGIQQATAEEHHFNGTRDQVRNACTGPNRELTEAGTVTSCADTVKGTVVACGDDGKCAGQTPRLRQYAIVLPESAPQLMVH